MPPEHSRAIISCIPSEHAPLTNKDLRRRCKLTPEIATIHTNPFATNYKLEPSVFRHCFVARSRATGIAVRSIFSSGGGRPLHLPRPVSAAFPRPVVFPINLHDNLVRVFPNRGNDTFLLRDMDKQPAGNYNTLSLFNTAQRAPSRRRSILHNDKKKQTARNTRRKRSSGPLPKPSRVAQLQAFQRVPSHAQSVSGSLSFSSDESSFSRAKAVLATARHHGMGAT